uniref:Protein FAR1-RELATED SEQUENCE n=1 Tax=Chenopodium quinoa TaxID=63459 RepID=A0A803L951_CHEQI
MAGPLRAAAISNIPDQIDGAIVEELWDEENPSMGALMYWGGSNHGKFSIKSAMEIIRKDDNLANDNTWNLIWKLKARQLAMVFIWLVMHDRIMTNANRFKRSITNDPWFKTCSTHEETTLHAVRDCAIMDCGFESGEMGEPVGIAYSVGGGQVISSGGEPNGLPSLNCMSLKIPNSAERLASLSPIKTVETVETIVSTNQSPLKALVYESFTVAEFERRWINFIKHFELEDNDWKTKLYEFPDKYTRVMGRRVKAETDADARCGKYLRRLVSGFFVEQFFRDIYTDTKFQEIQIECCRLMHCSGREERVLEGNMFQYLLEDRVWIIPEGKSEEEITDRRRFYCVLYNTVTKDVSCDCCKFETFGILCRHIIRVYDQNRVFEIPSKYVLDQNRPGPATDPTVWLRNRDSDSEGRPEDESDDDYDYIGAWLVNSGLDDDPSIHDEGWC